MQRKPSLWIINRCQSDRRTFGGFQQSFQWERFRDISLCVVLLMDEKLSLTSEKTVHLAVANLSVMMNSTVWLKVMENYILYIFLLMCACWLLLLSIISHEPPTFIVYDSTMWSKMLVFFICSCLLIMSTVIMTTIWTDPALEQTLVLILMWFYLLTCAGQPTFHAFCIVAGLKPFQQISHVPVLVLHIVLMCVSLFLLNPKCFCFLLQCFGKMISVSFCFKPVFLALFSYTFFP